MSVTYERPRVEGGRHLYAVPSETPPTLPPPPPRRPNRGHTRWLLAVGIFAVLVCGAAMESVPPGTPGHQLWTQIVGAGEAVAAPGAAQAQSSSTAQSTDPQLAAIQQLIQRANAEQTQAITSQNPSVMTDTATAAHYQQLTQINQQLLAQGVTAIQLTNLSWGPISVNGNSATATTYETWVTTFSDSTTMQSTDTNVYTLVLQNGNWLISDDQQPNSPASGSGSATASTNPSQPRTPGNPSQPQTPVSPSQPQAPTTPSRPQAPTTPAQPQTTNPAGAGVSRNWAGYVATGQTYTGVTGTWTVPQPSSANSVGVGATWVGIGGVSSNDLIQAGTQDVSSGGQSQFQAWIETLPQASQQVPLAVAPGDSVTVSIIEQGTGSGVWNISFKDNTSGQTYQTTVRYSSSQSSAEWIEEAPSASNRIVPIDNFGSIPFSGATAVANGQTIDVAQAGGKGVTMLNANGQAVVVPSGIGTDGSSFSVTRTTAPATPAPTTPRGFAR